jgi:hypothetical protein
MAISFELLEIKLNQTELNEPSIAAAVPVLLACICRSMRLQRMMPIGSSSEFPSLSLCSRRASCLALTMA